MICMGEIIVGMRVPSDESNSGIKYVRNQIVGSHKPCSNGDAHEQGALHRLNYDSFHPQ